MSFEEEFNAANIVGGMGLAASVMGGLLGNIVQAIRHGNTAKSDRAALAPVPCSTELCLRMVDRHIDHGVRLALRALDDSKICLDQVAHRHLLHGITNATYQGIYQSVYLRGFEGIQNFRVWHSRLYGGISHKLSGVPLGQPDIQQLSEQWLTPVGRELTRVIADMTARHVAVDENLRRLGTKFGDTVFIWRTTVRRMHSDAVARLTNVHNTMAQVLYLEIVERRTARELGE